MKYKRCNDSVIDTEKFNINQIWNTTTETPYLLFYERLDE